MVNRGTKDTVPVCARCGVPPDVRTADCSHLAAEALREMLAGPDPNTCVRCGTVDARDERGWCTQCCAEEIRIFGSPAVAARAVEAARVEAGLPPSRWENAIEALRKGLATAGVDLAEPMSDETVLMVLESTRSAEDPGATVGFPAGVNRNVGATYYPTGSVPSYVAPELLAAGMRAMAEHHAQAVRDARAESAAIWGRVRSCAAMLRTWTRDGLFPQRAVYAAVRVWALEAQQRLVQLGRLPAAARDDFGPVWYELWSAAEAGAWEPTAEESEEIDSRMTPVEDATARYERSLGQLAQIYGGTWPPPEPAVVVPPEKVPEAIAAAVMLWAADERRHRKAEARRKAGLPGGLLRRR